ncbi:MAG: YoaP domain-containing protein [Sarcina sp.]
MKVISVDKTNIDREHICCCIADKKGESCVSSKKAWMMNAFADGLTFKKLDARGKVFIEYIPAENGWLPIEANSYMLINCFWVSGQYKGQGISNLLLDECIKDSKDKGKKGIVVLSSKKKIPYLSDPKYLKYKGFKVADVAEPYFEFLYLPFEDRAEVPKIKECAKCGQIEEKEMKIFYSNQCPHTVKYVELIKRIAREKNLNLMVEKFQCKEDAQNSSVLTTTYSFFYDGKFVTNDILSEKKFLKFVEGKNLI